MRFVAVNRRDYPPSTHLSTQERDALSSGTDNQKAAFLKARGVEFATFVHLFAEQNRLPPVSPDGLTGGFAVLGWSLGCSFALATVAAIDALPAPVQARWRDGMRSLILQGMSTSSQRCLIANTISPHPAQSRPPSRSANLFPQMAGRRSSTRACLQRRARPSSRIGSPPTSSMAT